MSETVHSLSVTAEQAAEIFGSTELAPPSVVYGEEFMTPSGVRLQFADSRLGLRNDPEAIGERYYVTGNTVPRLCGAMGSCAANKCGLGERSMSLWERQAEDCAVANTVEAFVNLPGFVITPTNNEAIFGWDAEAYQNVTVVNESGNEQSMFNKVKPGSVFVFSEYDIADPVNGVFVAANNADNSLGTATLEIEGIRYVMVFSSSRLNLGDRDTDAQLLRKGFGGILDRYGIQGEVRQQIIQNAKVKIDIGYSADLKNFKHDVRLPEKGSDAANELISANNLSSYEELTPTIVMSGKHGQYPGALENGEVYGAFEAENDIDVPRSAAGCPGFGQYCYIHYPKITQRTLVSQLVEMGMQPQNIGYDTSRVISPASVDNRLASNRRMQLAGVPLSKTLRSVNGVVVTFSRRDEAMYVIGLD